KTTLKEILKHNPSEQLKQHLSLLKTTTYIDFMTIYEIIGIKDAIRCLRTQDYKDYWLFLADVAEAVLPIFEAEYPDDKRPRQAIKAIRDWHNGDITKEQLKVYADAAYGAYAASYAATAAAHAAYAAGSYAAAAAYTTTSYAAYAAAAATSYAAYAYAAYAAYDIMKEDWENIDKLFIKHFERNRQ
ncbi:MAG: hypothetical protein GY815_19925, partial [Gammaproteobacteria bacterium]|nr:hypothetical protein [Gammaproteobacteria bacterium]